MAVSWVTVEKESHFPVQNLPYGVFSTDSEPEHRIGVAIGSQVLDLFKIAHLFTGPLLAHNQVRDCAHMAGDGMSYIARMCSEPAPSTN